MARRRESPRRSRSPPSPCRRRRICRRRHRAEAQTAEGQDTFAFFAPPTKLDLLAAASADTAPAEAEQGTLRLSFSGVPTPAELAEAARQYDEVVARYTNPDGTKKPGWMKAPNGADTRLTERQWVQVRTPNFKRWFGDWEARAIQEMLENSPIATVAVGAFQKGELSVQQTAALLFENTATYDTPVGVVTIDARSAKNSLGHGYSQKKLDAIVSLQDDFKNSVYIGSEKDFDGKPILNHYFAYRIDYGGEAQFVYCRAREDAIKNRLYIHEVFSEDEIKKSGTLQTAARQSRTLHGGVAFGRTLLQNLFAVNPSSVSKVVDENGEPLVVAHSTDAEFTVFRDMQKNDAGWLGAGFYFFGDRSLDGQYGRNVMECFLNVREPYFISGEERDRLAEADDAGASAEFSEGIRGEGYDGVYYNGDLNREWAVFSPSQVKSATDNAGVFSARPDVRYSIAARSFEWSALPNLHADVIASTSVGALQGSRHRDERKRVMPRYDEAKRLRETGRPDEADRILGELESEARALAADKRTEWLGKYLLAKYHADTDAAKQVVEHYLKPETVAELKSALDPSRPVVALFPLTNVEGKSLNRLPFAYADELAARIGARVDLHLQKKSSQTLTRKGQNERASAEFEFDTAEIDFSDNPQIVIVDDTWTSGQTTVSGMDAILRANPDADVRAITTLASGRNGKHVKPTEKQLTSVLEKSSFPSVDALNDFLRYDIRRATGSELHGYILNGRSGHDGLRERFGSPAAGMGRQNESGSGFDHGGAGSALRGGSEVAPDSVASRYVTAAEILPHIDGILNGAVRRNGGNAVDIRGDKDAIRRDASRIVETFASERIPLSTGGALFFAPDEKTVWPTVATWKRRGPNTLSTSRRTTRQERMEPIIGHTNVPTLKPFCQNCARS